jgi:outer membrane autotransporter protein
MEKKSKFKKFLVASSALAVIIGAGSVLAAAPDDVITDNNAGDVTLADGAVLGGAANTAGAFAFGGPVANGNSFFFTNAGKNLILNGIDLGTLDINGKAGRTINVAANSSAGSVISSNAAATALLVVENGVTFSLTTAPGKTAGNVAQPGGVYTGLGNITLGSGGGGSTLEIDSNATLEGTIDSDNAQNGIINVLGGKTVVFNGILGGTKALGTLNLANGSTVTLNANATTDVAGNGFTLTGAATQLNVGNGVTLTGKVTSAVANEGVLKFVGAGVVTDLVGNNAALAEIRASGAGLVQLTHAAAAAEAALLNIANAGAEVQLAGGFTGATKFNADGKVTLATGKTITGAVDSNAANTGVLNFKGAGIVTGRIGATQPLKEIRADNAGIVQLQHAVVGEAARAQTLAIGNVGTEIQIGAAGFTGATIFGADGQVSVADTGIITGAVTTTAGVNGGKLVFAANGAVAGGTIGTVANALSLVEVTGAGTVDLITGSHYAKQFSLGNAGSIIQLADNGALVGAIVAPNNDGDGIVTFKANGAITGLIGDKGGNGVGLVKSIAAGTVAINTAGNHKVNFELGNAGSIFTFADGVNITGKITSSAADGNGTATFLGSGEVTGIVGANGNALATINLNGDANSNVKFGDVVTATNVNIGAGKLELNNAGSIVGSTNFTDAANGGTLLITGDANHNIGAINVAAGFAGGKGTVSITNKVLGGKTITFNGQIGNKADVLKSLKLLAIDFGVVGSTVEFAGANNSNIAAVTIGTNGGVLNFNDAAAATYKIGGITTANNKGTLKISQDTTFQSADADAEVNFGTALLPMARLEINGAKNLTLGHNINVYATDVFATNPNNGTITFEGDSTFSAAGVAGNLINDINVNGAGKTVKLLAVTNVNGAVTLADTAKLEISANFTAGNLRGKAANNGEVKFTNNAAGIVVAGTVGKGASLKTIEFAGRDVEFTGKVEHAANSVFTFSGKNATTVTFTDANTDVGTNYFVNNSDNGVIHTVVLKNANTIFNSAKLAENGKQINFQLSAGVDAELAGATGADFIKGANFTTDAPNTGNLVFNANNEGFVNSVGTATNALLQVDFTKTGGVTNGLFAKTVNVAGGQTANLGGRVLATNFNLQDDGSKVLLLDGATMDSAVSATKAGKGLVEFAGSGTLNQDIGTGAARVDSVTFGTDATKTVTLNANNIFAENAIALGGKVALSKNITLDGPTTTANNTTLVIGGNTKIMTVAAGKSLTFNGTNNLEFELVQVGNNTETGKIAVAGTLEYNAGTKLNVAFTGAQQSINPGKSVILDLITSDTAVANGKTLDIANVTMPDSTTNFIKWTPQLSAKGGLQAIAQDNAESALLNIVGTSADAADRANITAIANAAAGTDGGNVRNLLAQLANSGKTDKVDEALDRLAPLTTVSDAIESTSGTVNVGLTTRMNSQGGNQATPGTSVQNRNVASSGVSGISAGDDSARFGAWASPFFGRTTQKAYKNAAGYRSDLFGGSFGFDTKANDDMIIGAAVTVANNTMKHKNFKNGDKTKISSLMFSLYGMQQITDNWFTQLVATFGSNDIKNSEKRVTFNGYDVVRGKYTSMSFNGEAMFGYNFVTEQATVTPMAGLRYSRVNDGGYKEAGSTTGQNIDVNTKASNKLEVIAGLRVASAPMYVNDMMVTPEIHGSVNYDVIGKNPKQTLGLAGTTGLTAKANKPVRATYNLGLGVTAEYGMMEYGAGYDAEIATKRLGHQGTLKLRVNF